MTRHTTLELDKDGPVAELRLSRPELHNRFGSALFGGLGPALDELRTDTGVRAVVLSSSGRHFSAGGDTQAMLDGHADLEVLLAQIDEGRRLFRSFADFPKPLVAALHGHIFGVATSIASTGDLREAVAAFEEHRPGVWSGR